jgi:hypothetical protein
LPADRCRPSSFYSGDGTKMGWLDQPFSGPDRTLWMADGLARGAVALASGPIVDAFFSADTRFLVIRRLHDSTGSIGVIDLNAASPPSGRSPRRRRSRSRWARAGSPP